MDFPRRNLERKARLGDLASARDTVIRYGARLHAVERQIDTYFHTRHGRLKLREIDGQSAVLIAYVRPDHIESRISDYHLVPVSDSDTLKAALTAALGVRRVVRKRREIYLWHNIRLHLDEVEGLGTFIEFEAVLSTAEDEAIAHARLKDLGTALELQPAAYVGPSYSDLLADCIK